MAYEPTYKKLKHATVGHWGRIPPSSFLRVRPWS